MFIKSRYAQTLVWVVLTFAALGLALVGCPAPMEPMGKMMLLFTADAEPNDQLAPQNKARVVQEEELQSLVVSIHEVFIEFEFGGSDRHRGTG